MYILAVQCSGRKTGNTAQLMENLLARAEKNGHTAELVHLRDLSFDGCHSCSHCKLNKAPWNENAVCAIRDDLSDVLCKAHDADLILIGSPIYFGNLSSYAYAFLERLLYPAHVSDAARSTLWGKRTPIGYILTMSGTDTSLYQSMVHNILRFSSRIIGPAEALYITDTDQFKDYDKYYSPKFDAAHKAEQQKRLLTDELEKAERFLEALIEKTAQQ